MPNTLDSLAHSLLQARRNRKALPPLSQSAPSLGMEDAYQVSELVARERMLNEGSKRIGRKIGLTSKAVQKQLSVSEPDYGFLLSSMQVPHGTSHPFSDLLQAKAEGELAFHLGRDLIPAPGRSLSPEDVLAATDGISAAIEIIDSRIADWKITIVDTIADNASSAYFVLSPEKRSASDFDFRLSGMSLYRNGELASTGTAAACLGSPLLAVTWLANRVAQMGDPLQRGEIVLSGAFGPVVPFEPGDTISVQISGFQEVRCTRTVS